MTQTIDLTASATELVLEPVWRATPFVITGAVATPALSTWKAQLWRRPQDCRDEDIEPLATANGVVANNVATLAFTAEQMDISLVAGGEMYDDLWLSINGIASDDQPHVVKAGWLRVKEGGANPDSYPATSVTWTIVDDVIHITTDDGTYQVQGVQAEEVPDGATEGSIVVIDDNLYFTTGGSSWRVQGVEES